MRTSLCESECYVHQCWRLQYVHFLLLVFFSCVFMCMIIVLRLCQCIVCMLCYVCCGTVCFMFVINKQFGTIESSVRFLLFLVRNMSWSAVQTYITIDNNSKPHSTGKKVLWCDELTDMSLANTKVEGLPGTSRRLPSQVQRQVLCCPSR